MLRSSSVSCGLSKPIDPRYWGEIEDFLENCVTSVTNIYREYVNRLGTAERNNYLQYRGEYSILRPHAGEKSSKAVSIYLKEESSDAVS